jgi:PKD repeat protein
MSLQRYGSGVLSVCVAGCLAASAAGLGACAVEDTSSWSAAVVDPPPIAAFSVVCIGKTCTADAEASSDNGFLTNFSWAWGDGATTTGGSSVQLTSHTFAAFALYTITLTVTDNLGGTGSTSRNVGLIEGPRAEFTPKCNGLFCLGDAVLSGGPAPIVNYHWDWDDETTTDSPDNVVVHSFSYAATFRIHLRLTDANGQESGVTHAVTLPATF